MKFYLGTHEPSWLGKTDVPLFLSRIRLSRKGVWPRATGPWALDSGGFSELATHGRYRVTATQYANEVRGWTEEIGPPDFAAVMDWMCEPQVIKKTGLTVEEHQRRTVDSYLELRSLAPRVPWLPVLQGWSLGDYLRHVEAYDASGVNLRELPLVGVGTVCRRQDDTKGFLIISLLANEGLRLHGFGFKKTGLKACRGLLASADSLAWSYAATKESPFPGHTHKHCNNCLEYALAWRQELVD